MLFPDYRDEMTHINRRGHGYLHLDGEDGLKRVFVPSVKDFDKLSNDIYKGLTRK
jgi:hypothetical protein